MIAATVPEAAAAEAGVGAMLGVEPQAERKVTANDARARRGERMATFGWARSNMWLLSLLAPSTEL